MAGNAKRVQYMQEMAVVNLTATSEKKKTDWDRKAQFRQFEKGDNVYLCKSGLNTKLEDSWAVPYTVLKRNSSLSYRVHTGDRTIPSVHVQLLNGTQPRPTNNRSNELHLFWSPIQRVTLWILNMWK